MPKFRPVKHTISKQEFLRRARPAMEDKTLLPVTIEIAQAWILLSGLQLAYRHPQLPATTKAQIEAIGRQFQAAITELHPDVGELIEMGWKER